MAFNRRSIPIIVCGALCSFVLLSGCAGSHPSPGAPTPQTVLAPEAPGPDTIPCSKPVVLTARTDQEGVQAERAWLSDHYPGHGQYMQGLSTPGKRMFDVLSFTSADGRAVSVCFDITAWFGRY